MILWWHYCATNCLRYAVFTIVKGEATSLNLHLGGDALHVGIDAGGKCAGNAHSSETGLDADYWEFEKGEEERLSLRRFSRI